MLGHGFASSCSSLLQLLGDRQSKLLGTHRPAEVCGPGTRLLLAFFGGCLLVYALGRAIGKFILKMDGESQSIFALGGIFSNNVMLGVPMATKMLGTQALPAVALILTFNSLILWTLVTISIEWSKHGTLSWPGIGKTLKAVMKNPIVIGILSGTLYGLSGLEVPELIEHTLGMMGGAAMPLALIALGMGLVEYKAAGELKISGSITFIKLAMHPLAVFGLAKLLNLPPLETKVLLLLSSLSVGANVFLMAKHFRSIEGPIAGSLLLSTVLSGFTTPLLLTLAE